jgi:hypothetical protein
MIFTIISYTFTIKSDTKNMQQRLINKNYYEKRKLRRYFMWSYEQGTQGHAKIQHKIIYIYSYMNLAWFGFLDFYTKEYCEKDN